MEKGYVLLLPILQCYQQIPFFFQEWFLKYSPSSSVSVVGVCVNLREGFAIVLLKYDATKTQTLWSIQMVMNIIYMDKKFWDNEYSV